MKAFAALVSLVCLISSASARTVFSQIAVNGVDQGQDVAVRVPSSNAAITDITSNNIICNTNFIQPVSQVVATVPAGGIVTAQFHHTSAGYVGPDPSDPLDPTNKGPVLAYLAKIPDATQADVTGLSWFKIFQDGYTPSTGQWGSDKLFINQGNLTLTIPSCLEAGQYLLRAEAISLEDASSYPGAEFYMSCAQINITGGSNVQPAGVSFPGAYKTNDPSIIVPNVFAVSSYTPPGPAVFQC